MNTTTEAPVQQTTNPLHEAPKFDYVVLRPRPEAAQAMPLDDALSESEFFLSTGAPAAFIVRASLTKAQKLTLLETIKAKIQ